MDYHVFVAQTNYCLHVMTCSLVRTHYILSNTQLY